MKRYLKNLSLKNKKIFIIGGLGLIGRNITEACIQLGGKVTVLDIKKPNKKFKNIKFINFNISKPEKSEDIYREIKISMQNQTLGEETGKFFIREMIAKRKQLNRFSIERIGSKIIELTTGYGEKISNIIFTIIGVIIFCMFIYGLEGIKYSDPINGDRIIGFFTDDFKKFGLFNTLGNLFYFSVVVYSTVGFGEMLPIGPIGKSVMIFEGILGGLILAILIIALYKKSMDR